ncbi:MAG: sugar phosphate isomerase/epimerase family protein [Chitinophagaceae bacterium]
MSQSRRQFIQQSTLMAAGFALAPHAFAASKMMEFQISLAQWSLHRALRAKKFDNLDFPAIAKNDYGISVVEYVNQFFKDKSEDSAYLNQLLQRCKDNGVKNHLIMIDGEGGLAELDDKKRLEAVEKHYKWVHAAKYLGCQTIRVNAYGNGSADDVQKAGIDGLSRLGEYAAKEKINVIVENHGGYSSNGQWLSTLMKKVSKKNVGTLPDFGNFCIRRDASGCAESYDRYQGTRELMPFAKGVSAKTYDFDEQGNCIETDYTKIFSILKETGFKGYVGIEYEGSKISEEEGIHKTKALLERLGTAAGYKIV